VYSHVTLNRPLSRRIPPQPAGTLPRRRKKFGAPPRQPKFTEPPPQFLRRAAAQVILTHCDTCSSFIMKLSKSCLVRKNVVT